MTGISSRTTALPFNQGHLAPAGLFEPLVSTHPGHSDFHVLLKSTVWGWICDRDETDGMRKHKLAGLRDRPFILKGPIILDISFWGTGYTSGVNGVQKTRLSDSNVLVLVLDLLCLLHCRRFSCSFIFYFVSVRDTVK